MAIDDEIRNIRLHGGSIMCLEADTLKTSLEDQQNYEGSFFEFDLADLHGIVDWITPKFQTLTYFGVDKWELQALLLDSGAHGVDRIVPFGRGMDMGLVWDGFDLPMVLSRVVSFS